MIAPTWARLVGGVMTVGMIVLTVVTLLTACQVLTDTDPIVLVQCPDGMRAVEHRPPHPCPGAK